MTFVKQKVVDLPPSGIRKFFDLAASMEGCISLSIGEPDFVTPKVMMDAAIESLNQGKTAYTSNAGLIELREEICNYLKKYDLSYDAATEVLVTVGASEAIDLAFRALVGEGDEVLIPDPSFVCYGPLATMAGATPGYLNTYEKDDFRLTAEELEAKITPNSKVLLLPYPNNPTGGIMTKEDYVMTQRKHPLYTFGFGEFGCAFAPFEIFDNNAQAVREASPWTCTFYASCSYGSGGNGYLPDALAFTYSCYEAYGPADKNADPETFKEINCKNGDCGTRTKHAQHISRSRILTTVFADINAIVAFANPHRTRNRAQQICDNKQSYNTIIGYNHTIFVYTFCGKYSNNFLTTKKNATKHNASAESLISLRFGRKTRVIKGEKSSTNYHPITANTPSPHIFSCSIFNF